MDRRIAGCCSPFPERMPRSGSWPMTISIVSSSARIIPDRVRARGESDMHRLVLALSMALVLGGAAAGQNQKPQGSAPPPAPAKKPSPDFIDKVLKFLGI